MGDKLAHCSSSVLLNGIEKQCAVARGGKILVPGVRPWNSDGHAIVQAAFAVDFASSPNQQAIRELLALHSKLEDLYPRKRDMNVGVIGISTDKETQQLQPAMGSQKLDGFVFDSLEPNGNVTRSITLSARKLSIMRADYEAWDVTWREVCSIFELMIPPLLQWLDAIAFNLQYHDRFVWEGDRDEFRADMLFRPGTALLAPNVFEAKDLWHSHHGFFDYPKTPDQHQLLNVAEVQLVPSENAGLGPEVGYVADVKQSHRVMLGVERAGGRPTLLKSREDVLGGGDENGRIDTYMNEMHDKDKSLLAQLINNDMCDMIGLDRPR